LRRSRLEFNDAADWPRKGAQAQKKERPAQPAGWQTAFRYRKLSAFGYRRKNAAFQAASI
jgi:hypothetical protein